jgi:hypothetical protein
VLGTALPGPLDGQLDVVALLRVRRDAREVEHRDREGERLVGVAPLTGGVLADEHIGEPQQLLSLAGRRLRRKDDIDSFVLPEVVEFHLEFAREMRLPRAIGSSVDLDRAAGAFAAGRGDGNGGHECHSEGAQGHGDGEPYGSGHRLQTEAVHY